ncbi:MAG: Flp family type IVb pilin [Deltaproteobacteria bacterium]|nr:Flp family type IVb pilin [Deltaproteobacteria bacterium]
MVEFLQDEEGATMVEYGLMVALIAIVSIATVSLLGKEVDKTFTTVKDEMVTANGG